MNYISLLLLSLLFITTALNDARQANEAYRNGDYAKAEELYQKAINADPKNARLYFNMANALTRQGKTEEAIEFFEQYKAMTGDPEEQALADYNIGNIHSENQEWEQAVSSYKRALRYRPADEDAKHNYELARQKKEEQDQQQQQNQQQDQQKNNEEQNQDQQQDPNDQQQNEQNRQQQNQDKSNSQQNQDRQSDQQMKSSQINAEQAEKILKALEQKEKDLLKEFKKKKTESSSSKNEKDW